MISSILFIDQKGAALINRTYRDDVSASACDDFRHFVIATRDFRAPIWRGEDGSSFFHVRHGNIFVVACTSMNVNAALVFQFLHQIVRIMRSYFGGTFDEDAVKNNFVLIYELLDEILDHGYPQVADPETLKTYITAHSGELAEVNTSSHLGGMPAQVTGAVSWRKEGLKYKRNEIFLDVIENVNLLMSQKGTILRADVAGQVVLKAYLSGMPECKFGTNDKVMMTNASGSGRKRGGKGIAIDNVQFHQCVKLNKFESDRSITFVPPDGHFELMRYRSTENTNLPFGLMPVVRELGRSRVEFNVKVKSKFTAKLFGINVIVRVPVPENTAETKITVNTGKCKYDPETHAMVWKIRRFPGDSEFTMSAEVSLSARIDDSKTWKRPPIKMDFQVPMFTASGLHVRYLRVFEKSEYETTKWVRYITKHGTFEHRI